MVVEAQAAAAPLARRAMVLRAVLLGAAMPAAWALARFDVLPHVQLCLFQRFTGRACPGCGMTRSVMRLTQGDLVASLRLHPLGIVLTAALLGAFAGTLVGLVRGGDPVARFIDRWGVQISAALVTAFLALWVLRTFVVPEWAPPPV